MKTVKANKELKSLWSAGRRAITPKVGQLTNDQETITRISHEVVEVVLGSPRHPEPVYFALLSSLAKAILLQAEAEVTAEKRSAGPLAQVAAHALGALAGFAEAFWAKLVQRAGGWPVPVVVPRADVDGHAFVTADRRKALGFREGEGFSEYTARVTGLMRVYFHVLCADTAAPLEPVFRLPRMWAYFARMLAEPALLKSSLAPGLLHGEQTRSRCDACSHVYVVSRAGYRWRAGEAGVGQAMGQAARTIVRGRDGRAGGHTGATAGGR